MRIRSIVCACELKQHVRTFKQTNSELNRPIPETQPTNNALLKQQTSLQTFKQTDSEQDRPIPGTQPTNNTPLKQQTSHHPSVSLR